MSTTPPTPQGPNEEKKGVIYVSLYRGEPLSRLTQQIQSALEAEVLQHQPTIEIYGDIEDPGVSVSEISLSYPPYELTILEITPHNGTWSGFRLLATRKEPGTGDGQGAGGAA